MKISPDHRKKQYRDIFEMIFDDPRIKLNALAKMLELDWRTIKQRILEALEQKIIVGPHLRKRSCDNLKEYMYFLNCKNPVEPFLKLCENMNVTYHAKATGFAIFG